MSLGRSTMVLGTVSCMSGLATVFPRTNNIADKCLRSFIGNRSIYVMPLITILFLVGTVVSYYRSMNKTENEQNTQQNIPALPQENSVEMQSNNNTYQVDLEEALKLLKKPKSVNFTALKEKIEKAIESAGSNSMSLQMILQQINLTEAHEASAAANQEKLDRVQENTEIVQEKLDRVQGEIGIAQERLLKIIKGGLENQPPTLVAVAKENIKNYREG